MIDPNDKINRIKLTKPNPKWLRLFTTAAAEIKSILGDNCIAIHHIGSTSIPDIYAKPIVDMLPVVKHLSKVDSLNSEFEALGYICMGEYGISGRRYYWKSQKIRTHNVHIFEQGSPEILRHLEFKNFLSTHKNYAEAYSVLKRCLAEEFPQDIDNYLNGKIPFIQMIDYQTGMARSTQLIAEDNIVIEPYNPAWPKLAAAEIHAIRILMRSLPLVSIDHIGSTRYLNFQVNQLSIFLLLLILLQK